MLFQHLYLDIGECEVNNGGCSTDDTCVDVYGSFYCLRMGVATAQGPSAVYCSSTLMFCSLSSVHIDI